MTETKHVDDRQAAVEALESALFYELGEMLEDAGTHFPEAVMRFLEARGFKIVREEK